MNDDYMITKEKLRQFEDNLPKIIKEMIEYFCEKKFEHQL
jgi:hypothetical protein